MSSYLHVWADYYSVPEVVYTYVLLITWALGICLIYTYYYYYYVSALGPAALGLGHTYIGICIYQANPSCLSHAKTPLV